MRIPNFSDGFRRFGSALPLSFALVFTGQAHAKVLPTGPEVRAFLGGRSGKLIYCKTFDHKLYFIDFSDSVLVERKVSDDAYVLNPKISPDGSRVVYESYGTIWVRDLVANSPSRIAVMSAPFVSGKFYEPHWWVHPTTGDEYILWSTGDVAYGSWPPLHDGSGTYLRRIKGNQVDSAISNLMPFTMGGGRSRDGKWGATANHTTGMFKLDPAKTTFAFLEAKNWMDGGAYVSCNPTISPSKDPARMNRMLHLSSGFGTLGGKTYDNHKAVIMRSWDDPDIDHPVWYMGQLGDRIDDDSSGNIYWHYPEWSNDENYFTVNGSTIIENWDSADVYLVKINLTGNSKPLRVLQGGGLNVVPDLWVKDGLQPAKLRLDAPLLRFVSLRKDTAAPPPQELHVSNAGDGILPALQVGAVPKWLKITLRENGTNQPVLTHQVLRDSLTPGDYRTQVSLTYGGGVDSAKYTVEFSYRDPVLTTLKPKPTTAVLIAGESLRLQAVGLDQTGMLLDTVLQPAWSVAGPAAAAPAGAKGLQADGQFTADTAYPAPYGFIAVAKVPSPGGSTTPGGLACSTQVRVARHHVRVDAGWLKRDTSANEPAPAGWDNAPTFWAGQRQGIDLVALGIVSSDTLNLAGAVDAAPDTVYRSAEAPTAFRLPGLPKGRYRLRLHFITRGQPDSTPRDVSLQLEGKTAYQGRLAVTPRAKTFFALTAEAEVTVSDTDGLSGAFSGLGAGEGGAGGSAASSGIYLAALEAYDIGLPPVTVTSPNGRETLALGDTLRIRWQTDGAITSVGIQISIDSGKKWMPITRTSSVELGEEAWGNYAWVIPDSLDGFSLISDKVMVSVYDYFGSDRDRSDAVFTLAPPSVALRQPGQGQAARPFSARWHAGRGLHLAGLTPFAPVDLALLGVQGRHAIAQRHIPVSPQGEALWAAAQDPAHLPRGIYHLLVRQKGRMFTASVRID